MPVNACLQADSTTSIHTTHSAATIHGITFDGPDRRFDFRHLLFRWPPVAATINHTGTHTPHTAQGLMTTGAATLQAQSRRKKLTEPDHPDIIDNLFDATEGMDALRTVDFDNHEDK